MLVLSKGKHQRVQDEAQIGDELRARLLLQSGKRTEWGEQSKAKTETRVQTLGASYTLTLARCARWIRCQ